MPPRCHGGPGRVGRKDAKHGPSRVCAVRERVLQGGRKAGWAGTLEVGKSGLHQQSAHIIATTINSVKW